MGALPGDDAMLTAIPALAVSDFDTVTCPEDAFSGLVLFVTLPNGAEIEVSVAYDATENSVTLSSVVHCGDSSTAIPSNPTHYFTTPCTSFPMPSASSAFVS